MAQCDESFGFITEWYDAQAELVRRYRMTYFVKRRATNEVELYDLKNKRTFLKRVPFPSISVDDLFIGNTVRVYARMMKIVDFCDAYTKARFGQSTPFVAIFPDVRLDETFGDLIGELERTTLLRICKIRLSQLSVSDARVLAKELKWDGTLGQRLSKTATLAVQLTHPEGARVWDSVGRKIEKLYDISSRASSLLTATEMLLGSTDGTSGPALTSASRSTATCANCTACVIKPHAVKEARVGNILSDILKTKRWKITALKSIRMDVSDAEKYLEVYRGVARSFNEYVNELASCECVALEIVRDDGDGIASSSKHDQDVVSAFRKFAGPFQFDFAKKLRPDTLRAKYGSDDVHNAIHCTDLPEDGPSECAFLFRALS